MSTCKVICITNRNLCEDDFLKRIECIAKARPSAVILREKDLTAEEYYTLAVKTSKICKDCGTPLILHYFADIAAAIGAEGLHLPFDMLVKNRNITGKFKITGTSCHSVQDAIKASSLGCSYIIAGHIFPTECKKGVPARGLDFLKDTCSAVNIPVFAIGGINAKNAGLAVNAGAAGVCSMSGFMACADAAEYIKGLKNG